MRRDISTISIMQFCTVMPLVNMRILSCRYVWMQSPARATLRWCKPAKSEIFAGFWVPSPYGSRKCVLEDFEGFR